MSQDNTEANDNQETSPFGMSDEEFANIDPSDFPVEDEPDTEDDDEDEPVDEQTPVDQDEPDDGEAGASAEANTEEGEGPDVDDEEDTDPEDSDADTQTTDDTGSDNGGDGDEETDADPDGEADPEKGETETEEKSEVDYKAEYENLLKPFRANGKDMQVNNIDEARQLMQMGANYNKKMAGLKPSLKTLKLLENNNLLDEGKLSYLIDLDKKNPDAIKKLIKDSGIDPMEMDVDSDSDYKPNTYTVDDREVELDSVLESIRDTPTYNQTIEVVSNKWDAESKTIIANNPQVLELLNTQMANGIYKQISNVVERERSFGRLNGLSDIEAYKQVGDWMDQQGKFDAPAAQTPKQTVKPKPKRSPDPKLKEKKRAASSTKAKPTVKAPEFDPLGMSDEAFLEQFNEKLL